MLIPDAILLNLMFGVGLLLCHWAVPPRRSWARASAVLLLLGLAAMYLRWRLLCLPILDLTIGSVWPWTFFVFEGAALVYETWSHLVMVRISDHSPEADHYEGRLRERRDLPSV